MGLDFPPLEVDLRYLLLLVLSFFLIQCGRVQKLVAGKYQVADDEYSSQNYNMQRTFGSSGAFEETHVLDRCLLVEMSGDWKQNGGSLSLAYRKMHTRANCKDSLPAWAADSSHLTIPIRNVDKNSFESLLAASDGHAEKWLKWVKLD
jgi:hypothetical protein